MKKELFSSLIAFLMLCPNCLHAVGYDTQVFDKLLKSLQVEVDGTAQEAPIIELNGNKQILIDFDYLLPEAARFDYSIIHCDADWTPSALAPIEYMDGFNGLSINDYSNSINTTVQYVNYQLLLPNDDVKFKVSGNYVVKVYNEDDPSKVVFTACFSVMEPQVTIGATVSSNTDIDQNKTHQQVSFSINHRGYQILQPLAELKIRVLQNRRRDNVVSNVQPSSILPDQLVYANNRSLIFNAGDEYRRFEFLSHKYNGMNVDHISFHNPYYHVELYKDINRSKQTYQYDQDQDGRYFPACSSCNNAGTEADYYVVHFALDAPSKLNGSVFLNGNLVNNQLTEENEMDYNEITKQYEKSIFLKQGNYNYQYLFVPNGGSTGETATFEGDFYQTENEYSIYVYHRPIGSRYDRLIGTSVVRNTMKVF